MIRNKSMAIFAMLIAFATAASAGNLIEIAAVSKVAVPESREMTYAVGDHREVIHIMRPALINTDDVAEVVLAGDPQIVSVKLSADGAKKFSDQTSRMAGERLAIIAQGKIRSAPIIRTAPLGGSFEVSGFKDATEAKAFVNAFKKARG